MNGLVRQLKEEHKTIIYSFGTILSNIKDEKVENFDVVDSFRELRTVLVSHLDVEDKLLYPKLASSEHEDAKELGKKFSDEMMGITKVVIAFFDKYGHAAAPKLRQDAEFNKEVVALVDAVKDRIDKEEKILFPVYDKYYGH